MPAILAATDLTPEGDAALPRAGALAGVLGLPLVAVTVVPPGRPVAEAEAALTARLEAAGLTATAVVAGGSPDRVLAAEIAQREAALIVLGSHHARTLLDAWRETTAESLLKVTHVPVLLVRTGGTAPYGKVLVPVSFSEACGAAAAAARMVAPTAEVRTFHVMHIPFQGITGDDADGPMGRALRAETEAQAAEWLARHPLPAGVTGPEIVAGTLGVELDAEIDRYRPDLIALGAHTRKGLAPFALGSTAAEMIRNPPADLLLVRGATA